MKIGEIHKKLLVETGFDIPLDMFRRYEKLKLLPSIKKLGRYRDYTDEQYRDIKKVLIARKIGVSIKDLGNKEVIDKRVKEVLKVASQLRKQ